MNNLNLKKVRAALYGRYSTKYQSKKSVEDQHRECAEACDKEGFEIVGTFGDREVSGGTAKRPGYKAMIEAARTGKMDVIIAEDVSRMWRNRKEYGSRSTEFEDLGVGLVTCVGDDTRRDGWMIVTIKLAMAEQYRKEVSYRTRRGLRGRALQKLSTGGRAYGYTKGENEKNEKIRLIAPAEAKVVQQIYEWRAAGRSGQDIARQLNAAGVLPPGASWTRTHKGPHAKNPANGWTHSCIVGDPKKGAGILNNPLYKGDVVWSRTIWTSSAQDSEDRIVKVNAGKWVEYHDEALRIVSDDLWNKVRSVQIASNPRREAVRLGVAKRNFRFRSKYLLGGTLVCGVCGCNYIGDGNKDYLCPAHTVGQCSNDIRFRREDAHKAVVERFIEHFNEEALAAGRKRLESKLQEEMRLQDAQLKQAVDSSALTRLDEEEAATRRMNLRPTALAAQLAAIEAEREELKARAMGKRTAKENLAQRLIARLPKMADDVRQLLTQAAKVLSAPELVGEAGELTRRWLADGRIVLTPNLDHTGVEGAVHLKDLDDHVMELAGWKRQTRQETSKKLIGSGGAISHVPAVPRRARLRQVRRR